MPALGWKGPGAGWEQYPVLLGCSAPLSIAKCSAGPGACASGLPWVGVSECPQAPGVGEAQPAGPAGSLFQGSVSPSPLSGGG